MQKVKLPSTGLIAVLMISALLLPSPAALAGTAPKTNDGVKWRIGYFEGGPWPDYYENLLETAIGLSELGWMEKFQPPKRGKPDDARALWQWLARNVKSPYLEFAEDAFWSSNWEDDARETNRLACIKALQERKVDLMIAMGTWAGLDLANNKHSVPTLVMSTTDPIQAGIIKSAKDSGFDHVTVECDPTRYLRQIRLFHDIIQFKRLGYVCEDSPEAKAYSNEEDLKKVAKERGFKLVECYTQDTNIPEEEAVQGYLKCLERIAPDIDAFYFSAHQGAAPENMHKVLAPLMEHKIPTWSNWGMVCVKTGALMSVGRKNFKEYGAFYAKDIALILNGAKPRDLDQIMKEELSLAINLETARIIGYTPPKNLLKIAEFVFTDIETP
ncbi:ABC-type uncharacterized transport system, periplasmic component [Desulfatibacillum aliphaticivorans]|uniref:ABC-type uncharacterized transport system, periplasmic component n=1 Tax=Desulfatibacillum aliphaticivorans TaxID=218208 RepID=B8FHB3_DESAL|nr:ABC transporter substrate binding protein [Desulfatibacillum aliphaticivorans]ACL02201.1 ABC-type uncharacterized transport system, periplasmic component [Desulfatibacillum aliphaticivorans]